MLTCAPFSGANHFKEESVKEMESCPVPPKPSPSPTSTGSRAGLGRGAAESQWTGQKPCCLNSGVAPGKREPPHGMVLDVLPGAEGDCVAL